MDGTTDRIAFGIAGHPENPRSLSWQESLSALARVDALQNTFATQSAPSFPTALASRSRFTRALRRGTYDNRTTAVEAAFLGKVRKFNKRFGARRNLRSHGPAVRRALFSFSGHNLLPSIDDEHGDTV
jgi:hypothetical protein